MRHGETMRYLPTTAAQRAEMLRDDRGRRPRGAARADPVEGAARAASWRSRRPLAESDLIAHLRGAGRPERGRRPLRDRSSAAAPTTTTCPSAINHLLLRGEFFTAYTPYQPEASQGTLRTIYEYQTMICELTGMDVTNASLYDGGSALAEAALMAHGVTEREQIVVSGRAVAAGPAGGGDLLRGARASR